MASSAATSEASAAAAAAPISNASGRYEPIARIAFDDGWQSLDELPPFKTTVAIDADAQDHHPQRVAGHLASTARSIPIAAASTAASIVSRGRPTPISASRRASISRSKLFMKPDAPALLESELSAPGYEPRTIAIGTNTDPYQPIERQSPDHARHPRSAGARRPSGRHRHQIGAGRCATSTFWRAMAERNLVKVALSVTTLDPKLARTMEPRASTPPRRLEALRQLSAAGVPAAVMVAPVIPAINDAEIERILDAAAAAGVQAAGYVLLRLPLEVRDLFREWLMAQLSRPLPSTCSS